MFILKRIQIIKYLSHFARVWFWYKWISEYIRINVTIQTNIQIYLYEKDTNITRMNICIKKLYTTFQISGRAHLPLFKEIVFALISPIPVHIIIASTFHVSETHQTINSQSVSANVIAEPCWIISTDGTHWTELHYQNIWHNNTNIINL